MMMEGMVEDVDVECSGKELEDVTEGMVGVGVEVKVVEVEEAIGVEARNPIVRLEDLQCSGVFGVHCRVKNQINVSEPLRRWFNCF